MSFGIYHAHFLEQFRHESLTCNVGQNSIYCSHVPLMTLHVYTLNFGVSETASQFF